MIVLTPWVAGQPDQAEWDERYSKYLRYLRQHRISSSEKSLIDRGKTLSLQDISNIHDMKVFLAYEDKRPVGFAIVGEAAACLPDCSICIKAFYVFPEYRKCGIGTEMLRQLYEKSQKNTCYVACLQVALTNSNALDFWIQANRKLNYELCRNNQCSQDLEYGRYVVTTAMEKHE